MINAKISYIKNPKDDEYYTPYYAIKPLLKYLPKNITIWECTDFGNSKITSLLRENGYNVISTHISNFDFINDIPDFDFDMIITNPPYSIKDAFIEKCYKYNKPFALLLPITALEGSYRSVLYQKMGCNCLYWIKELILLRVKLIGLMYRGFVGSY